MIEINIDGSLKILFISKLEASVCVLNNAKVHCLNLVMQLFVAPAS